MIDSPMTTETTYEEERLAAVKFVLMDADPTKHSFGITQMQRDVWFTAVAKRILQSLDGLDAEVVH